MSHGALPFRLDAAARAPQLAQFNARPEVQWLGFRGDFEPPGTARVRFARLGAGALGGGGTAAINGGVIAAGFDAAFVLVGLGHYDSPVVVTLELSVKFVSLALATPGLAFSGRVVRSARHLAFVEGTLEDMAQPDKPVLALASGIVAPR